MNVATVIHGIAVGEDIAKSPFIIDTHIPNQKICTRKIPKLIFDISSIHLGAFSVSIQLNNKNAPKVNTTQLRVQKAQPISITGVSCKIPGTACT